MANRYWVGGTGTWNTSSTSVWSATSGGPSGASVPTAADDVFFDQVGTYTVTRGFTGNCRNITVSAGIVTFTGVGALNIAGSMSLLSTTVWSGTGLITFTGSPTVTTNGATISASITYNAAGGTMALGSELILANTRTFTLTEGTLNLNTYTLSTGLFSSSNANTRAIAFGTGNITVNGASGTLWTTATTTGLSTSGTQVVNVSNSTGGATTITSGSLSETNSISFNFTTGTYALTHTAGTKRSLNFTGFSGTVSNTAQTIYGDMVLSNGATFTGGANIWTLGGTTVSTRDVDLANKTALGFPLAFNASGSTFRFLRNTTLATYTWSNGNLNLNGFQVTAATLVRSGTSTVTAGGGRFKITGSNTTVVNLSGGVSATDDVPVELTYAGGIGTRTILAFGDGGFSLAFSGAATDTVSFPSNFSVRNFDTTGFSGTLSFGGDPTVYGSLFFNSTTTVSGAANKALNLSGSATQHTLDATTTFPTFGRISFSPLSNYLLNKNITVGNAPGNYFAIIGNAALDLNGKTVTAPQGFAQDFGGNSPTITMSGGAIVLTGDNVSLSFAPVWDTTGNPTFIGSGTISCTSAGAKYIGPVGRTLPTINQGGTGTLSLEDDGTGTGYALADLTSTATSATIIQLQQFATTVFTNFSLSGTATAQVTLRSNGSQATVSKASGTVSASYLTIQDIAATGGATWNAYTSNGNVDGGGNTGINFSPTTTNSGNFFSLLA